MSDLDTVLKALATALVDEAPEAPDFDTLTSTFATSARRSPGPRRTVALVAAALVLVAIVIAVVVSLGPSGREEPAGPTRFVPCQESDPGNFRGPDGQTFGPVPNAHPEGGTVTAEDIAAMPDYIPVWCQSGTAIGGWIKKTDMLTSPSPLRPDLAQNAPPDIDPVYADDGTTVVGHMYSARGFVPLGTDSETLPTIPVESNGVPTPGAH